MSFTLGLAGSPFLPDALADQKDVIEQLVSRINVSAPTIDAVRLAEELNVWPLRLRSRGSAECLREWMEGRTMNREPATLIILAGGESKRMGFPKHRLTVDGELVINRLHRRLGPLFVEAIVVGRDIEDLPPNVRVSEDHYTLRSPLVGIHAGLSASTTDLCFVVACDMPYIEPPLVEFLLSQSDGFDVVVPIVRGHYEPLCAIYRRGCLPAIEQHIGNGVLKVSKLYGLVDVREVSEKYVLEHDLVLTSFANLNVLNHAEGGLLPGTTCFTH